MMMALVLGVFFGCSKDEDENLPLAGISGTYDGTFTVDVSPVPLPTEIVIAYNAEKNKAILTLDLMSLGLTQSPSTISVECTVTSTKDSYSLSGNASFADIPVVGNIDITINNSSSKIEKSGKATIAITTSVVGVVNFDGQKK